MTTTVTQITIQVTTAAIYQDLATTLGEIAVGLLIVLLVVKELMRAGGGGRAEVWERTLNVAAVPLLLAFGLMMAVRFAHFLGILPHM